jgi:hypothetical protein
VSTERSAVTLDCGTVIGEMEPWDSNPALFGGWLVEGSGVSSLVAEGMDRDRTELEIIRLFLVREIKVQEKADQSSSEGVERNRLIQEGFRRQKALTSKILREQGEVA